MKKIDFKKFIPHIVAVVAFLILSIMTTKPALEGMVVQQHDVQQVKAMQQQSFDFKKEYGYFPYWTNSMFGGMPTYQIALMPRHAISNHSVRDLETILTLGFPKPVYYLFITCLCFYFLCIVLGINPWVSILGGIAYGYCTYNPILIAVGHDTKLLSMAYAPAVIGSMLLIFKKKYWLGAALLMISAICLLAQNHQQIVFYTLLIAGIAALYYVIKIAKSKDYKHLLIALGTSAFVAVIALLANAFTYFSTYDYAKESMRGGSELTSIKKTDGSESKGGLDRDYAFSWSYGIGETLTFIVPNAYGGGSSTPMPEDSKVVELLQENQSLPQQLTQQLYQEASAYWGAKPSTSGPVYFGAIICLLALLGLLFGKNENKWWLLAVTVIGIMLAWGKNFGLLNNFLFDHLPFYNKFRTPEMAMVIPQLSIAVLAALFVNELVGITDKETLSKLAKNSLIATGAVVVLLAGFYFMADFKNDATTELKKNLASYMQQANNSEFTGSYINAIVKDRQALYASDMWRSIGFILVGIVAIFLFCKNIIKAPILYAILILATTIDLMGVDKRYLNNDNFVDPSTYNEAYADYNADIQINRDPGFFRVLNLAFKGGDGNFQASIGNAFNDAIASYKHNNIGGYHPAKLSVFEDLKERQLYNNIQAWSANPGMKDSFPALNMLNMKYVILPDQKNPKQTIAIQNPYALGNCWLVKEIKFAKTADEEMADIDHFDPATTAIVNDKFKASIPFSPSFDSTATIKMLSNKNDEINYEFNASSNQFAVFSEMYYSKGWEAYIDGKKVDYCKVDYALRGLAIPAGKHSVKFVMNPTAVILGEKVSGYAGLFSILFVLLSAFMIWRNYNKKDA